MGVKLMYGYIARNKKQRKKVGKGEDENHTWETKWDETYVAKTIAPVKAIIYGDAFLMCLLYPPWY